MRGPGSRTEREGSAPRLVLAIDDEPAMLAALRRTLRDLPIRLVCLGSAEEALEVIRMQAPAVIVSDHRLPGITGLELLVTVRSSWPQVRSLLHTSDATARERARRLELPAVEKGAAPRALRAMVSTLLGDDGTDGRPRAGRKPA